jgi:lipid II:glycine glycyltransferase (peptidoglycan interpeptide bridge formation enzyme)
MNSDKKLAAFKEKVINATNLLRKTKHVVLAGAIIVKHLNRISVFASGINKEYSKLNPNHFLHYAILERYKNYFSYCDLGGVTGNFDTNSAYFGLNDFKKNWNSTIYEFIGEFDIVCHEYTFKRLIKTSFIEKEFNKHPIESYGAKPIAKKDKQSDDDEELENYE